MERRSFLRLSLAAPFAASFGATDARRSFASLRNRYFLDSLRGNPVVATYLGAGAEMPELDDLDGALRDLSESGIASHLASQNAFATELAGISPLLLDAAERVDHAVMSAQISFRARELGVRRAHQRAIDAYVLEPFRGVSLQIRDLDGEGDWKDLVRRIEAIPRFLEVARENLLAGIRDGNLPDKRLVRRDGIEGALSMSRWFDAWLPSSLRASAPERLRGALAAACAAAAAGYRAFSAFLDEKYDAADPEDRYALGSKEYDWRLRTCLDVDTPSADLWDASAEAIAEAEAAVIAAAAAVSEALGLGLSFRAGSARDSVRSVSSLLESNTAKDERELFRWYGDEAARATEFAARCGLFRPLPIATPPPTSTPEVMRQTVEAAYFPAPPLRRAGRPTFYVTAGADQCRASIAVTAVHELIPGHHFHYERLRRAATIRNDIRWLTPGDVESSFSMWSDSAAIEGWATLAEEIAADGGHYSAAERFFQCESRLLTALARRVEIGLHSGVFDPDEALDLTISTLERVDGAVARAPHDAAARALCTAYSPQIYRWSKLPIQGVSYGLGRDEIVRLENEVRVSAGPGFRERDFFETFLGAGTIPPRRMRPLFNLD